MNTLIAISLVTFGTIKFSLVLFVLLMPQSLRERLQKNEFIRNYLPLDTSLASRILDFAIMIFAIYAMIKGFLYLVVDKEINHSVSYTLYAILGLFLLVFYSLVLYTDLPIDKAEEEKYTYELGGVALGVYFMANIIFSYIYHYQVDVGPLILLGLLFVIFVAMLGFLIAKNIKNIIDKRKDVLTVALVPLAS